MATLAQIGEGSELAGRTAVLEATEPQPESQPTPSNGLQSTTHRTRTLLRALASALIAPILLAAALVVFLVALADFSWFRLRDLHQGHPHPKGLWEF